MCSFIVMCLFKNPASLYPPIKLLWTVMRSHQDSYLSFPSDIMSSSPLVILVPFTGFVLLCQCHSWPGKVQRSSWQPRQDPPVLSRGRELLATLLLLQQPRKQLAIFATRAAAASWSTCCQVGLGSPTPKSTCTKVFYALSVSSLPKHHETQDFAFVFVKFLGVPLIIFPICRGLSSSLNAPPLSMTVMGLLKVYSILRLTA